ncbi:MAG: hypothetical protein OEW81_14000 [Gammaproteobacteria bacterium]|nr:hypothetical protein [Gammaproteobacteria bacterium]
MRILAKPGWIEALRQAEDLPADYLHDVCNYIAPLAENAQRLRHSLARPVIFGINGAQGSGKSTLARFLAGWLQHELALTTAVLSLDDLYFGKSTRKRLAQELHPLFATRGVPGTHDIELGNRVLDMLTDTEGTRPVALPRFDKASDDFVPQSDWYELRAPVDVVLLEGWCVGASAQAASEIAAPINALEAEEDSDATWRSEVNRQLRTGYAQLFKRLDALVMLRVPGFEKVLQWRGLQEQKMRRRTGRGQTDAELQRFVQHYERLTRHMLQHVPQYADTVIDIDANHRMVGMQQRA